jgi:hypothetical protein
MSAKARPNTDNGKPERRTRADDKFDRYAWRDAVFADPKTPANAKCLAFGIAKHVNGETGEAVVSTPKLAKVCGFSATWVRNTIPVLHNIGWAVIEIGSKGRGKDHCNVYRINPEKRTPYALLKRPENRRRGAILERAGKSNLLRLKSHLLRQKAHPVCEEPLNPSNPKKERGSAARASDDVRESASSSTVDDAPVPATDGPLARTAHAALNDHLAAQKQPTPSRDPKIGTGPNGADADPAFAEVYRRGREVLGADADAVVTELLAAHDGYAESALDALAAAEEESDPRQYVKKDIEAEAAARRQGPQQ